jgi:hypothetical protein
MHGAASAAQQHRQTKKRLSLKCGRILSGLFYFLMADLCRSLDRTFPVVPLAPAKGQK